jgi:hypothetical protein
MIEQPDRILMGNNGIFDLSLRECGINFSRALCGD